MLPQGDCLFTVPASCRCGDPFARADHYSAGSRARKQIVKEIEKSPDAVSPYITHNENLRRHRLLGFCRHAYILHILPCLRRFARAGIASDFARSHRVCSAMEDAGTRPATSQPTRKDAAMGNQQIYAKIGVFVLLGINVTAYYFFWPRSKGIEVSQADVPKAGRPSTKSVKPKELPRDVRAKAAPPIVKKASEPEEEALRKLLDHIAKDMQSGGEPSGLPLVPFEKEDGIPPPRKDSGRKDLVPAVPLDPDGQKPRPLPPLKADPLLGDRENPDISKIAVTSPLTAKTLPSPWQVQVEEAGKQKLLIARLQQGSPPQTVAEFRVLCDRVETDGKANEIRAVGDVVFRGAGLRGECGQLVVSLPESRVIFAERVRLFADAIATGGLRGDHIEWDWKANAAGPVVRPGALGAPK